MSIKLARVDDRLIHGQVVTNWLPQTGAQQIIIIDDATASDSFTSQVIKMSAPQNIDLLIMTLNDAKVSLNEKLNIPTMLLAKTPSVFLELVKAGINIPEVNLGGMGANKNRTTFYRNISASTEEKRHIKQLQELSVPVYIQILSGDKRVDVDDSMLS